MVSDIQVGDRVKLLGLPDWPTHDLPVSEQMEMRTFIGQCTEISKIDDYDCFWLGFGSTVKIGDTAYYSGIRSVLLESSLSAQVRICQMSRSPIARAQCYARANPK